MWATQFGWDGMQQVNSSYFQAQPPVKVASDGTFSIHVAVDGLYGGPTSAVRCL